MINVEKLKYGIFDFDDTLCIHSEHTSSNDNDKAYNERVFTEKENTWNGKISQPMAVFMQHLESLGIKMGLMSATSFYQHAKGKHDWVLKQYGVDLENYSVGNPEEKIQMLIAIADANRIERDNILIVDDYWKTLEMAADAGFQACSPMEAVNFVIENALLDRE